MTNMENWIKMQVIPISKNRKLFPFE